MPAPLLQIDAFQFNWLSADALRCYAGEITAISGDSGSGKSRVLRALADLDPNTLEVSLAAPAGRQRRSEIDAPIWRQQVQYLPAEPVWWTATAGEMLDQPNKTLATSIGLDAQLLDKPIGQLSTGERQRCALLRALSVGPRVLLLDEPTAALDKTSVSQVEALLQQWVLQESRAIIWVSHDADQRQRVAQQHWQINNRSLSPCP